MLEISIIGFSLATLFGLWSFKYTEGIFYKRIISSIITGISAGLLILNLQEFVKIEKETITITVQPDGLYEVNYKENKIYVNPLVLEDQNITMYRFVDTFKQVTDYVIEVEGK